MRPRRPPAATSLASLQALVENRLPDEVPGGLIGLLGDRPSAYSRSPAIWTPALQALGVEASYLPLDVPPGRLADVLAVLRRLDACWGANVTVPYKEAVVPLLDEVTPAAAKIGAVNTIVRHRDARLAGTNTDTVGVVAALLQPGEGGPLVETLYGLTTLLIGAGGAARAAAVALAAFLGTGELVIADRNPQRAEEVAAQAIASGGRARVVLEPEVESVLPSVGLVVNASSRGQGGIRKGPDGWTCLEPYAALAPASPAVLPPAPEDEFMRMWTARSSADIAANVERSRARMRLLPPGTVVFDMIYAPPETATVRLAREAGLRAANGRWMMIVQAVEACVNHICARIIAGRGLDREAVRSDLTHVMGRA